MITKQCFIIGGGSSIRDGISLGLQEKLKNKFIITINFAFNHFENTFTMFSDAKVWNGHLLGNENPYIDKKHLENIKKQPLLISIKSQKITNPTKNLILLPISDTYKREKSLQQGFYAGHLTGIFALGMAEFLMDYNGEIFLLGFDWSRGENGSTETHYYPDSEIKHRGQYRTTYYNHTNPDPIFKIFIEPNLKIYNVSPNSNINCFEKIDYTTLIQKIDSHTIDQKDIRTQIRRKLNGII